MLPPQFEKMRVHGDTDIRRILIVEDDMTLKLLWQQMVNKLEVPTVLEWATSDRSATKAIEEQKRTGGHYDVVVCDIFLSGNNTGIDFWRAHRDEPTEFVFTSGVSGEKFKSLLEKENFYPLFLPKPLDPKLCVSSLNALLKKKSSRMTEGPRAS